MESSWEGMIGMTSRVEEEAAKGGFGINADKTKLMTISNCDTSQIISTGNKVIAEVDELCFVGCVITKDSSCDKKINLVFSALIRNSTFGASSSTLLVIPIISSHNDSKRAC